MTYPLWICPSIGTSFWTPVVSACVKNYKSSKTGKPVFYCAQTVRRILMRCWQNLKDWYLTLLWWTKLYMDWSLNMYNLDLYHEMISLCTNWGILASPSPHTNYWGALLLNSHFHELWSKVFILANLNVNCIIIALNEIQYSRKAAFISDIKSFYLDNSVLIIS